MSGFISWLRRAGDLINSDQYFKDPTYSFWFGKLSGAFTLRNMYCSYPYPKCNDQRLLFSTAALVKQIKNNCWDTCWQPNSLQHSWHSRQPETQHQSPWKALYLLTHLKGIRRVLHYTKSPAILKIQLLSSDALDSKCSWFSLFWPVLILK